MVEEYTYMEAILLSEKVNSNGSIIMGLSEIDGEKLCESIQKSMRLFCQDESVEVKFIKFEDGNLHYSLKVPQVVASFEITLDMP